MINDIPVVLFAYARPEHLTRVLHCLQENRVPLIHAFSDGAKGAADSAAVGEVRRILHGIDWTKLYLIERDQNLGLGRNIMSGVGEVADQYEAFIVWEDDLICMPGTYAWLSAALHRYADDERVMSVTAWTHPRVTPPEIGDQPYFDGRAECWAWGAWRRSWRGMTEGTAWTKLLGAERRGVARSVYGSDLPAMAKDEIRKNTWAVRWLCHHLERGGLCLRPPWSLVEHIGFGVTATNAGSAAAWANPPLRSALPLPSVWPEPREHRECRRLWRLADQGGLVRFFQRLRARLRRT